MMNAPVVLFVYKRLDTLKDTIYSLKNNYEASNSALYIFSDNYKDEKDKDGVVNVRNYIKNIKGFKEINIFENYENIGLASSVISGVTKILSIYDKVIVLEDDLITKKNYLLFMNYALERYKDIYKVMSVNGYSLKINCKEDIYFQNRPFPWGWGTWKNRWTSCEYDICKLKEIIKNIDLMEFNQKCGRDMKEMLIGSINGFNSSWYARWTLSHYINHAISMYPAKSFISNIGFCGDSTHSKNINEYVCDYACEEKKEFDYIGEVKVNKALEKEFLNYFTYTYKVLYRIKLLKSADGFKLVRDDMIKRIK